MKPKIADYQAVIRVIQDIQKSVLTQEQVLDIILKIAELHPAVLVEARELVSSSELGIERTVVDFLRKGKKIMAIKYFREATGVGLKEAKDYVDAIEAKLST